MKNEVFKDLVYRESIGYEISNYGRVRQKRTGRILEPGAKHRKYYQIGLTRADKTRMTAQIHRLVAVTFITPEADDKIILHKDGDTHNNHVDNLIVTDEVMQRRRFTEEQIHQTCKYIAEGKPDSYIKSKIDFNAGEIPIYNFIYRLRNKQSYLDISSIYF